MGEAKDKVQKRRCHSAVIQSIFVVHFLQLSSLLDLKGEAFWKGTVTSSHQTFFSNSYSFLVFKALSNQLFIISF